MSAASVVIHRLRRRTQVLLVGNGPPGIRVAVKAREVAAGNFHADAMAREKNIAGHARVDRHAVVFAGFISFGFSSDSRYRTAQYAVGEVARVAVRKHVHQLGGEIGVAAQVEDIAAPP